ncbi:MAG: hypothetical protein IMY84_04200 [Chloroflexi bacterium]|nr:hypothetical protein [Chloroflexota bacterium]
MREDLALGLRIRYGDEVAGLFVSASRLFDAVAAVRDALHPDAAVRFVVTRGRIGVASRDIRKVGGPAFKEADDTMERLKKQKRFVVWRLSDSLLDAVLDSLTGTANVLLEEMTANQRAVFALVRRDLMRVQVAERLGKSKQSVSSAAVRGNVDLVVEAEDAIRRILAGLGQRDSFVSGISEQYV